MEHTDIYSAYCIDVLYGIPNFRFDLCSLDFLCSYPQGLDHLQNAVAARVSGLSMTDLMIGATVCQSMRMDYTVGTHPAVIGAF
ncbi:hypothetical protein PMG11_06530 [Penicillium brasilianum]|uniref:Uncharacterized protein n=1 Tax=Penicillium brasilianum TaxID=104259 RepID=A0A0F7TS48_PENBI|nr:hypothetical protein PMG11_06530 [Penicillium brasilianum]